MVGHLGEETLRTFQVDKAFIGVGGITLEHGLTEFNFDEAGMKRTMIERARQRIVVADHTKFGKVMLTTVASLTVVDRNYQTNIHGIFAIGTVVSPSLDHADSIAMGKEVASLLVGGFL